MFFQYVRPVTHVHCLLNAKPQSTSLTLVFLAKPGPIKTSYNMKPVSPSEPRQSAVEHGSLHHGDSRTVGDKRNLLVPMTQSHETRKPRL